MIISPLRLTSRSTGTQPARQHTSTGNNRNRFITPSTGGCPSPLDFAPWNTLESALVLLPIIIIIPAPPPCPPLALHRRGPAQYHDRDDQDHGHGRADRQDKYEDVDSAAVP